jgi:hypothetical protein
MKKTTLLLLSFTLLIAFTNAQETTSKSPCFRVSSFSSSIGFGGALTSNTDTDYYLLQEAAENPNMFVDIKGLNNNGSSWNHNSWNGNGMYYGSGGGNGNLLFNLGITPYSKKLGKFRDNREIRVSLGGSFGSRNSFYYYDDNYFTIDTLQSVNGNDIIYADSITNKNYYYTLDYSEINFGLSYLFKTDVNRRTHFYAGFGMNYGITLRSTVSFDENTYRSVYYYNEYDKPSDDNQPYYGYYDNDGYSYSSSSTNLKSPMQFVRFYIPIGFSLRLSKKPVSFFSHVDLYTELNPGVELQILSADKTYANPYIGVGFIGFRYHW